LAAALGTAAFADQPYFVGIGDLPPSQPPGNFASSADAVSPGGLFAVGFSVTGGFGSGFPQHWDIENGIRQLLPRNGFTGGGANGVSLDGLRIVGSGMNANGKDEAYLWTAETGLVGLGDLPGGNFFSTATAISWDGRVICGYSKSALSYTYEAYRWTAEDGMVPLGDLPGGFYISIAYGMSADGNTIVGMSVGERGTEAFRWTAAEGMIGLGDLPGGGVESHGYKVSGDGRVVIGRSSFDDGSGGSVEGFRWTEEGGMEHLESPYPPGYGFLPSGCNYDGSVIVGNSRRPLIWTRELGVRHLRDLLENDHHLDLSGWELTQVWDISADGRTIVGQGRSPNGPVEGWVAYLGPPPCLGDLNHDNAVNMVDLVALLIHFGDTLAGPTEGDLDRDADVDLSDLTVLLAGYGRVCD